MSNRVVVAAELNWCQLEEKNRLSNKYQFDVCQLSEKAVDALEALDINVKHKEDRGFFITCKSTYPIEARMEDGTSLAGVQIGNGTQAKVIVEPYNWTSPTGTKGTSPSLVRNGLVVTELEVYSGGDDDEALPDLDNAL
jgi:hypothetical protein